MGYTFVWKAGEEPYFITPGGQVVMMEMIGGIPYIREGSDTCAPREVQSEDLQIPAVAALVVGGGGVEIPDPPIYEEAATSNGAVDSVAGGRRKRKLPDSHYLNHKLACPELCDACARGKLREARSFKGAFQREANEWGHHYDGFHGITQR